MWLFSEGGSTCPVEAPAGYACAVVAWTLLLVVNLPWAFLICLPCLLLCKCEFAFSIIASLAGIHRNGRAGL